MYKEIRHIHKHKEICKKKTYNNRSTVDLWKQYHPFSKYYLSDI